MRHKNHQQKRKIISKTLANQQQTNIDTPNYYLQNSPLKNSQKIKNNTNNNNNSKYYQNHYVPINRKNNIFSIKMKQKSSSKIQQNNIIQDNSSRLNMNLNLNIRLKNNLKLKIQTIIKIHQQSKHNHNDQQNNQQQHIVSPIIQIAQQKQKNKLVYHCFKKFKSYNFVFDKIIENSMTIKREKGMIIKISDYFDIQKMKYIEQQGEMWRQKQKQKEKEKKDTCLIVFGGVQSGIQQTCQGTFSSQGLFYSIIQKFLNNHIKKQQSQIKNQNQNHISVKYTLQCLIINEEDVIIDAAQSNQVQIRQMKQNKYQLSGSHVHQISSAYEAYTFLKECFFVKKKSFSLDSIFVVIFTVEEIEMSTQKNKNSGQSFYCSKQTHLFIQWTTVNKSSKILSQNLKASNQNHSLLILNQCILELMKFSQKAKTGTQNNHHLNIHNNLLTNQIRPPFRDSKITRLLKPYLLSNTYFSFLGCITKDQAYQQSTFQTLMLAKHLSKLQLPLTHKVSSSFSKQRNGTQSPQIPLKSQDNSNNKNSSQKVKNKLEKILKQSQEQSLDKWIQAINEKQSKAKQQLDILQSKIDIHKINILNSKIFESPNQTKKLSQKKALNYDNQNEQLFQQSLADKNLYQLQIHELQKMDNQFVKIKKSIQQIQNQKIGKLQKLVHGKEKASAMKKYYTLQLQNQQKQTDRYLMLKQMKKNQIKTKIQSLKEYLSKNSLQVNHHNHNQLIGHNINNNIHHFNSQKSSKKVRPSIDINMNKNSPNKNVSIQIKNKSISVGLQPINRSKNYSQKLKTQVESSNNQKRKITQNSSSNNALNDDRDKFYEMYNEGHNLKLAKSLQRRRQFLKNKVKEGRVQQQNFLDINANRYKSYQNNSAKKIKN